MLENGPKKQAQGAPERYRKMLQNSINNRTLLDPNPSSEASWALPAAEKRPTRAPRGPRTAKTMQSERQESPKNVSRAIFSKFQVPATRVRSQGCGSQPSRTLCLLGESEKVAGPSALKRRLLSHFARANGVSDSALRFPPSLGTLPLCFADNYELPAAARFPLSCLESLFTWFSFIIVFVKIHISDWMSINPTIKICKRL